MFLTVVALLSMTMTFAEDEKLNSVNEVKAYDMRVNYDKVAESLGLSMDQQEAFHDIHKSFCIEMLNAANANKDERKSMVDKAVMKELKHMRYVLTNDQYRKYCMLLNTTFNNRGLNK